MNSRKKSDVYRSEINRLIAEVNGPACPYDGHPCPTPETGCSAETFGMLGAKTLWNCPRCPSSNVNDN